MHRIKEVEVPLRTLVPLVQAVPSSPAYSCPNKIRQSPGNVACVETTILGSIMPKPLQIIPRHSKPTGMCTGKHVTCKGSCGLEDWSVLKCRIWPLLAATDNLGAVFVWVMGRPPEAPTVLCVACEPCLSINRTRRTSKHRAVRWAHSKIPHASVKVHSGDRRCRTSIRAMTAP